MGILEPYAGYHGGLHGGQIVQRAGTVRVMSTTMAWLVLLMAGVFEVVWAVGLKYAEGFTKPLASTVTVIGMVVSVGLLSIALKSIPLGTGYAVWTGIGAVGTALAGMMLFGESRATMRLVCMAMIVAGIVGLKLFSETTGSNA